MSRMAAGTGSERSARYIGSFFFGLYAEVENRFSHGSAISYLFLQTHLLLTAARVARFEVRTFMHIYEAAHIFDAFITDLRGSKSEHLPAYRGKAVHTFDIVSDVFYTWR